MNAYKLEFYGKMTKVVANTLALVAVAVGMYQASYYPDTFFVVFSQWFFALLAGILALSWVSLRVLRQRYPVDDDGGLQSLSVVELPRHGPRLVRWEVLYSPSRQRREMSEALRACNA